MITPAPWSRVKPLGSRYWTIGVIRHHVAEPLESDADWNVAEAAPDLLASLRELLAEAAAFEENGSKYDRERNDRARAAIAKAERRT